MGLIRNRVDAQQLVDRIFDEGRAGVPHAHEFGQAYLNFPGDWIASFQHALSLNVGAKAPT